jgi:hypothetical protein
MSVISLALSEISLVKVSLVQQEGCVVDDLRRDPSQVVVIV